MSTEKIDNVEALKLGEDANNNDAEGACVAHAKIWTGVIKEEPEQYFHPNAGEIKDILLIQIQPTKLKNPVWMTGGWIKHPYMTRKGTRVQFTLDSSPAKTFQNKDRVVFAESRLGTMAASMNFEWVMQGQNLLGDDGVPETTGDPEKNPAWREGMAF